jgi:hypothetical protein
MILAPSDALGPLSGSDAPERLSLAVSRDRHPLFLNFALPTDAYTRQSPSSPLAYGGRLDALGPLLGGDGPRRLSLAMLSRDNLAPTFLTTCNNIVTTFFANDNDNDNNIEK